MAEPFKNRIDANLLRMAARHLRRAWRKFPDRRFLALATDGLQELELKARVRHVAGALAAVLPEDFDAAATVLEQSLAPARVDDDLGALVPGDDGLAGWIVWPMTEYVAVHGLRHPPRALAALHALTQRFSAEFAVRPFLVAHERLTMATLRRWTGDPSPHVRRLVSEGSRPRLPWGLQLRHLIADPSPTLPLLERLQDDPSEYVRRSVANHLNDIAKDHPAVVVQWLAEHLPGAPPARRALLRHASRTLIKHGHPAVMKAWGLGRPLRGDIRLEVAPKRVRVGDALTLSVALHSTAARAQPLQIDYAVHHVKANGATSAKVFKGWSLALGAREARTLSKTHSMREVTTRRYHPGRHELDLRVNGEVRARAFFELLPARPARRAATPPQGAAR